LAKRKISYETYLCCDSEKMGWWFFKKIDRHQKTATSIGLISKKKRVLERD
jgi:hypothetical protein